MKTMENFEVALNTRIVFGPGKFGLLGKLAKTLGNKAMIVTGKSAIRRSARSIKR